MLLQVYIARVILAFGGIASTSAAGEEIEHEPYAVQLPIEQVELSVLNGSDSTNPESISHIFGRQGTGRCYTSSGERFDCLNPAIDSCCQGATEAGCCDGTKKLRCITPASRDSFCCYAGNTVCGSSCCAFGWTCCSSATSTCCSDDYGQCCGGICCELSRTCCGGNCCNEGFTCGGSQGSCVRITTPVLTVTITTPVFTVSTTTVVGSDRTNVAMVKKASERLGAAGAVLAAAGFL